MSREELLDLSLRLFPYPTVYPQQQAYIERMLDTLMKGKVGVLESPTGTGKTLSLLCASLAFQQLGARDSLECGENDEPEWIRSSRINIMATPCTDHKPKRVKMGSKTQVDLDEHIAKLLGRAQEDSGSEDDTSGWTGRKIIFASRTHSQLSQAMGEMKRVLENVHTKQNIVDFTGFTAISLGSRTNLCVNKEVAKISSTLRLNERCLELQQNEEDGCPYYNEERGEAMGILEESIKRLGVADIEDMHGLGLKTSACPYYASKAVQASARFIMAPYNVLLQKETREAFGLDLTGSIVIIDEAHNLIDAINQMHSMTIQQLDLAKASRALTLYHDRYGRRMSPQHSQLLLQLIQALSLLSAYQGPTSVQRINDFLHTCMIDNLNFFPIQAYANESHVSQKISSFYDNTDSSGNVNLLNDILRFLSMLMNSDANGRVIITAEENISLRYISLSPEGYFNDVLEEAHSVVLAGGTMTPYSDIMNQLLGVGYPAEKLTVFSADHLIPADACKAVTLACGPTGIPFDFNFANRDNEALLTELGQTIVNLVNVTPDGIVCFFPSHTFLAKVMDFWGSSGVLDSIKGKKSLVVEGAGSIEALMQSYREGILRLGGPRGSILFGVMNGRLSEGINFSDRLARLVIIVGLPFPNAHDPETKERLQYYLRRKQAADLALSEESLRAEYLENICMRSVNQALGRVIRHKDDYAAMILLDQRYQKDRIESKVAAWVRRSLIRAQSFPAAFREIVSFYKQRKS